MNDYKLILLRTLKIAALIVPALLLILFLPVSGSEAVTTIRDFYREETDSLDVILFGPSDVFSGYSAPLAYEEYGITSFSYVFTTDQIEFVPFQIEDTCKTQSPELIIIELTEFFMPNKYRFDILLREYLSGLPTLERKREWVEAFGEKENQLSYYFPFALYHGTVTLDDMIENVRREQMVRDRGYSLLKNNLIYTGFKGTPEGEYVDDPINPTGNLESLPLIPEIEQAFIDLLNYCRDHVDAQVLFVMFPHRIATENIYLMHLYCNSAAELIRSYGYDCINMGIYFDDIGLDMYNDFYDDEHMNLYGQYKTTRYLCDILVNEYGVSGRELSPLSKERWDTCVEYQHLYRALFEENFKIKKPNGDGIWLTENVTTLNKLEEMRRSGAYTSR